MKVSLGYFISCSSAIKNLPKTVRLWNSLCSAALQSEGLLAPWASDILSPTLRSVAKLNPLMTA